MPGIDPVGDRILLFLILGILILLSVTTTLAILTILLRLGNIRRAGRWARLEGLWDPLLRSVLEGKNPTAELLAAVERRDRFLFLQFLTRHARGAAEDARPKFQSLAEPFLSEVAGEVAHRNADRRARAIHALGLLCDARY